MSFAVFVSLSVIFVSILYFYMFKMGPKPKLETAQAGDDEP